MMFLDRNSERYLGEVPKTVTLFGIGQKCFRVYGRPNSLEFLRQTQQDISVGVEGRSIVEQHLPTRRKIHKVKHPHNPRRLGEDQWIFQPI